MYSELSPPVVPALSELLSSPQASAHTFIFSTLIRVIRTASLDALLDHPGPFTVFAPNDGAFARMSEEEFDHLVHPENESWLVAVLTYHIVPGHWPAASLLNRTVRAVNGERVAARQMGQQIRVNNAELLSVDMRARNGIVHEIDSVLLPPKMERPGAEVARP